MQTWRLTSLRRADRLWQRLDIDRSRGLCCARVGGPAHSHKWKRRQDTNSDEQKAEALPECRSGPGQLGSLGTTDLRAPGAVHWTVHADYKRTVWVPMLDVYAPPLAGTIQHMLWRASRLINLILTYRPQKPHKMHS
jgi:hypothetical protein